jgi:hypothetical protein
MGAWPACFSHHDPAIAMSVQGEFSSVCQSTSRIHCGLSEGFCAKQEPSCVPVLRANVCRYILHATNAPRFEVSACVPAATQDGAVRERDGLRFATSPEATMPQPEGDDRK